MRPRLFDPSSPRQWLLMSAPPAILFLLGQVVTIVPYANLRRDKLLWDLATAGGALLFFALACLADYRRR